MADVVYGTGVVLSMLVDATLIPMLCATDTTYECRAELVERTGPTSGGSRQFMRRLEEHFSLVTGLTKIENELNSLSWFYILQTGIRREVQTFELEFSDPDGANVTISGTALIGTMGINGPVTDFSSGSIEIWWDTPNIEVVLPPVAPVIQDPIYFTLAAGDDTYNNVLLTDPDTEILTVALEGTQHDVVLSGTPGNREVKFTLAGGVLQFEYTEVVDREGYILYQH